MNIIGSPDLSTLGVQVTWDISGTLPVISLVNLSTGTGLANVSWWFIATSPSGTFIHEGEEANPDIIGVWSNHDLTDNWPRPFGQIEFSGAQYSLVMFAKDSAGNVYQTPDYTATICRPAGNLPTSKNFYGLSKTNVQIKCDQKRIWFADQTNHSYKGLDGTLVSSALRMVYPIDETGNIPTPFVISNFSTALVPISYSSDNYQFQTQLVYDYDMGGYVHVRIRYQSKAEKSQAAYVTFAVLCNIDLCPLVCEYTKLIESIENGSCGDVDAAQKKLNLITPKLMLAQIGKQEPLCGIDVAALIDEIKEIGGFDCDCCNAPTGIIPDTSSVIDGYSFSIVSLGGDVGGTVTTTGSNIQFNLFDKSYVFKMCDTVPTDAFSVTPTTSGDGFTKTYCLNVDLSILSEDILNTIKTDANLVNLFNSIVVQGSNIELAVDGGCIFQSTSAFDYTFTLSNIPLNTTYAILTGITISAIVHPLNYQFNITNIAGLQTYLNSLGIGTFVVTNPSGQTVLITSTANGNALTALTYKISGTTFIADFTSVAAGYIALTANQVVQYIINYLCNLEDNQLVTSQEYSICYIDPVTKAKVITVVPAGTELSSLLTSLVNSGCFTVDYITSLGAVTCATIQNTFPASANLMVATDFVLGTKAGACARIYPVELGIRQLLLGAFNQDFVNAFCALVEQCGSGLPCAPYNIFQVTTSSFNPSCPSISDFNYVVNGSNTVLSITKLIFANTPLTPQTVTVEYRVQGSGSYTLLSSSVTVGTDGTPVASIDIPVTSGFSFDIRVSNNCSSPADYFVKTVTIGGGMGIANLTFSVSMAGSSPQFTGTLNNAIDSSVLIDQIYSDGFLEIGGVCDTDVASAHSITTQIISAGNTTITYPPDGAGPDWTVVNSYSVFDVQVNGSAVNNGDTMVIGGFLVTMVIPSCQSL